MRVAHVLLCPAFAWFASLQFNDSDALPWVVVYALVSLMCLGGAFGRVTVVGSTVLAVVTISWAAVLSFQVTESIIHLSNDAGNSLVLADDEVAREVGGLIVAGMWCIVAAVHAVRKRRWRTET
jgi:hypothetical protein